MLSTKRSILYVDDDGGARLTLTLLFGQQGYEVLAVSRSQAIQFVIPEESFDLYLLGARLSEMYKAALCRKIRAFDRDTPIIICAGDTKESKQESALCVGCTIFISKLDIDKLLDQVKAELEF